MSYSLNEAWLDLLIIWNVQTRAQSYQTGTWTSIKGKNISTELNDYDEMWDDNYGIQEITLYQIDIDTGEYIEGFNGTLLETINFLIDN